MPGFQLFFLSFLHHYVLAKLSTISMRVKRDLTKPITIPVFHSAFELESKSVESIQALKGKLGKNKS